MPNLFPRDGAGAAIANGLFGRKLKSALVNGVAAGSSISISGIDPKTDQIVSVIQLKNPIRTSYATGAAKGSAITVTGITTSDYIISAIYSDLNTADVTITSPTVISDLYVFQTNEVMSNTTATTGKAVFVNWYDISEGSADLTSVFSINGFGTIKRDVSATAIAAAAYDDTGGTSERMITLASAFTNYSFVQGDTFTATSGTTGGTLSTSAIRIAGKVDSNIITLAADLSTGNNDVSALAGYITTGGTLGTQLLVIWADNQING